MEVKPVSQMKAGKAKEVRQRFGRSRTNQPENANSAANSLKISVPGNQSRISKFGQGASHAINERKLMQGFDLTCL
jgi:hypothetical protein